MPFPHGLDDRINYEVGASLRDAAVHTPDKGVREETFWEQLNDDVICGALTEDEAERLFWQYRARVAEPLGEIILDQAS